MNFPRKDIPRPKKCITDKCHRCYGSGAFANYGTCFRCGGSGKDPSDKTWAHPLNWSDDQCQEFHDKREERNQKNRDKKQQAALEKAKATFTANVELLPELLELAQERDEWHTAQDKYITDHCLVFDQWYGDCLNNDEVVDYYIAWKKKNEPTHHHILKDLFHKASHYPLSEKQCALFRDLLVRHKENEAKRKVRRDSSNHQGSIGDRVEVHATVNFIKEFFNDYGATNLVNATDEHGNVFITWYSGSQYIPEQNEKVLIKGRIIDHSEYEEVPQTVLTRCKFISEQEAA
jgi:hypothetical protein